MIFNLPPLLGLFPLLVLIVLCLKGLNPVLTYFIGTIVALLMIGTNPLDFGSIMYESLGSLMALIGFIVMLGSGLGAILKKTGVAEYIVHFLMDKIGVKSAKRVILATMIVGITMSILLGTMTGGNAVIAPIIIPLVASVGLSPATVAVILHGASQTGLFVGPLSPPALTCMGVTGMNYFEYLFKTALPVAAVMWVGTYIIAVRTQKATAGKYLYPEGTAASAGEYKPTPSAKRATIVFCITMLLLLAYGMYTKGGTAYAMVVILGCIITTGLAAGMKPQEIAETMLSGGGETFWLFVLLLLCDPFMKAMEASGAFSAVADLIVPLAESGGKVAFAIGTVCFGVFGVSGAHVAQVALINDLFGGIAATIGLPVWLWAIIVTVGTHITCFVYPGSSMLGAMGMARSSELKYNLKLAWQWVIPGTLLLCVILTLIFG